PQRSPIHGVRPGVLATMSALHDATLSSLFWIGANYNHPVDLPDTTGLSWREMILRCLESVRPQSRTSPPAVPESRPPAAPCSSPLAAAPRSSLPAAAQHSSPLAVSHMASHINIDNIMDLALPLGFDAPILSPSPSPSPPSPPVPAPPEHPPVSAPPERPPEPAPPELFLACGPLNFPQKIWGGGHIPVALV
ncbi:hypothetical protein M9458_017262, partial [Cirrhinus mrigala]